VEDIIDVLRNALTPGTKRDRLLEKLGALMPRSTLSVSRPPAGMPAPQG